MEKVVEFVNELLSKDGPIVGHCESVLRKTT